MVLENRLGITDSAELARTEEKISKQKALTLFEAGILDTLTPLRILNNSTYDFHLYILLYHISCHIPMIFVQKNYFTNSYSNSSCLFSFFNEEKYFSKYSLSDLSINNNINKDYEVTSSNTSLS